MAKLGTFYALCPLIDTKNFFGVSEDPQKGVVIVTLGKNIASRYKVSDQKQISCWRTKDKFSSPVIYDALSSKYVSVFNTFFIRMWDEEEAHLDKVKKYKFNKPIHSLVSKKGQSFVIFQNGAIYKLEEALECRKTLNPNVPDVEQIDEVLCEEMNEEIYFGMVVKTEETHVYWTKFDGSKAKYRRIKLERSECTLAGYVFHMVENDMHLLTLWSDGAMYACPLGTTDSEDEGEPFSSIDSLSAKHPVSMTSLGENYVALYGANSNEEGAVLVAYDTRFKMTQSKQPFKLFTCDAKVWRTGDDIFVPVGQNLAVVPFSLETQTLADLVGSRRARRGARRRGNDVEIVHQIQVGCWEETTKAEAKDTPKVLSDRMNGMMQRGCPEDVTLEEMLPEVFEKNDIKLLAMILEHFTDISDRHLSKILKYLLNADRRRFGGPESPLENLPPVLQPARRTELINRVLCRAFNRDVLFLRLRSDLSTDDASALLKYIQLLLEAREVKLPGLVRFDDRESRLCEWLMVLMNSSHQKFLLTKDESRRDTYRKLEQFFHRKKEEIPERHEVALRLEYLGRQIKKRNSGTSISSSGPKLVIEQVTLY